MKQLFLALLMAAPLHAYDVKAVYADYLTALAIYNSQNLREAEEAWGQAFGEVYNLFDTKDRAAFVQSEMLPVSQKLAKAAKEAKDGFKTKEAAEGMGMGFDILILCDTLSTQLFEAFGNSDRDMLRRATQTLLEIDALEGQRAETVEAFLTKLRKEMRKAKIPQSAIEAVK